MNAVILISFQRNYRERYGTVVVSYEVNKSLLIWDLSSWIYILRKNRRTEGFCAYREPRWDDMNCLPKGRFKWLNDRVKLARALTLEISEENKYVRNFTPMTSEWKFCSRNWIVDKPNDPFRNRMNILVLWRWLHPHLTSNNVSWWWMLAMFQRTRTLRQRLTENFCYADTLWFLGPRKDHWT